MHGGPVLDCCFHDDSSGFSASADNTVRRSVLFFFLLIYFLLLGLFAEGVCERKKEDLKMLKLTSSIVRNSEHANIYSTELSSINRGRCCFLI
jgi:hypothetical protein